MHKACNFTVYRERPRSLFIETLTALSPIIVYLALYYYWAWLMVLQKDTVFFEIYVISLGSQPTTLM